MAPTSSMKIDDYRRITQDFLDVVDSNPTLAGIEGLRDGADKSLEVVELIQLKGEDSKSCTELLQKLLDLMENVYHTFKTTRTETLLGSKTKKTTKNFFTLLDSLLTDLCEEFDDNGTPIVPAVFAELEEGIDELKQDLEGVRKTLVRRETRTSMTSQGKETSRPATPETKQSKKTSRSGTVDSSKSTEKRKSRTNSSIPSPSVKKSTSYGARRDTSSRKDAAWLEFGEEEHGGYESPDEEQFEPKNPAGHRGDRNAKMGRGAHPVHPQGYPPMYGGMPQNAYPSYYPQHQGPPPAGPIPPNAFYHPQPYARPSIDPHGLAMLFSQMQTPGHGSQINVDSGNVTGNVYENVGNYVIEKRGAGKSSKRAGNECEDMAESSDTERRPRKSGSGSSRLEALTNLVKATTELESV